MQIIEKKVYEKGNDNNQSYTTRQRANAGLTLGIIGTVAGVAALWGRNGGGLGSILGAASGGGGGVPGNVNINNNSGGGSAYPSAFTAYSKECDDVLALTNEMWGLKVGTMQSAYDARNVDVAEKFALYNSQVNADFGLYKNNRDALDVVNNRLNSELFSLYKYTRDKDDETRKELSDLKAMVAINSAVRPYQDKLIQCEIDKAFTAAMTALERKTCKMLEGVVTLPTEPTVTGLISQTCCNRALFANGGGGTANG